MSKTADGKILGAKPADGAAAGGKMTDGKAANKKGKGRFFEFYRSPSFLIAASPLVIAGTSRLAFALISALALLWVYGVSAAAVRLIRRFSPKKIYYTVLSLLLFSMIGSFFLLIVELVNPVLAKETALLVFFAPVICFACGIGTRSEDAPLKTAFAGACVEALRIGLFLVFFALVREPLGYGSLSLPGGARGVYELFRINAAGFPVQIIASSAGALLLLGYIFLVFRMVRTQKERREEEG
jgi:Na+-transporting NADH:ubiquinone oxidoreductase subunit NqrD